MVTRPELAGLEALKQQALQKNRMMNPEERDRIGSLGKPKTFLDLYNQRKFFQESNPEQTYGTDAFFGAASRHTETPGTDGSLLGRMQPEGDNLQEEIQNMSDPLFRELLKKRQFGEAGQEKLDKIYSTGPEYTFFDAYNEREELTDDLNLGPYGSIDSLLKGQRLLETEEQKSGLRSATSDLTSLVSGIFFSDKTQTGVPFFTDENAPPVFEFIKGETESLFGKTQGELVLAEDSTLYTKYDSREKALADSDFLSRAKDVKNNTDFYSAGMQMNVAGVLRLEGQSREDGFYVPIVTLDEEQKAYVTNIISREDNLNIAGQALGLAEIAATPVQGLYKGVFMAFGKSIDLAFNEGGKLTTQSLKALEELGTSPGKIKQIENNAKLRIMYSKATKKSITKPATKIEEAAQSFGRIESQAKPPKDRVVQQTRSETMDSEQLNLIKKYRKEGLSAAKIAEKPDINYSMTTINYVFKELDLFANVPTKRIDFKFSGSKTSQQADVALANMHVDTISQFLREGEDLALLDSNIFLSNYKSIKGGGRTGKQGGQINHGPNQRGLITNVEIYLSKNITNKTSEKIINKRNYMLQTLEQDQNFVNYANKNFDGNTSAALDDILTKAQSYNKAKGSIRGAENYRIANIYPKIDIIEKKFSKQIAAGKIPSLEQVAKALKLPEEEYVQAARAMFRYFDAHRGNLTMPDTYKFIVDPKIADSFDDIIKTFRRPNMEGFYESELYRHYEKIASKNVFGKPLALQNAMVNYRKANNLSTDVAVDHVGGLRALARNNNSAYAPFVQQLPARINEAKVAIDTVMGQTQKNLKNLWSSKKKWKPKEWAAEVERVTQDYRLRVANFKRNNPTVEFFEFTVDKNAIPKGDSFTKAFKENGYGFIVSDTMDVLTKGNAMGGTPISREKFQTPGFTNDSEEERLQKLLDVDGIPGTIANSIKRSLEPVQDQIRGMYEEKLQSYFDSPMKYLTLEKKELEKELSDRLNPPKPVKFKFSELPRLITQGPIAQALTTDPKVAGLETIEFIYNSLRKGVENDIEMKDKFPKIYKMNELTKVKGPGATPKEADYISAIDEINRAADTGLTNFAYNVGDLLFSIPDAVLPTEFTDELKRRYEKSDLARPETFVGQISAVALEFGIPGGIAFKLINRFRKFAAARTGGKLNLFTQKTYGLEGLPKLGVQISNVAKRVGTGAISFGAGDFIAGGPYNTISEMFDDPLLTSKYVGEYEDTSELSGKERVLANFKNRLRFAGEGAIIGGLFPLAGPALGAIGKQTLLKPALFLGGGALKIANTVAIKPATYLASLDPVVLPGLARGAGSFARFLGQDVLARLAATAATGGRAFVPSLKGNFGQLPEFSKWRMFDVTSNDPLERGLKKVDNFLKWFRDSGNQALYGFNLSGGAERFIKAKSREIEKYLDSIEKKAYDLANGFLGRYNKGFTSPAGERQMLEQVFEYLRGNLKLSKIEPELQEMSKVLKDEFNALKQAYFKELPEGSGLRAALESNLDKYMRMSFATFTNPNFTPNARIVEQATDFMVDIIMRNEDFLEAATRGVGVTGQTAAIREFARKNVENIITIGKREGVDPINALNKINREILRGDEVFLQTGEELPQVIRSLLGQEKSLRNSVMMTTGALVSQTANIRSFKEFARHGLENGYLFTSRAEALAAGVSDPKQILELPGLGPMQDLVTADKDGPIGLFASNELKQTMQGTGGMLDNLLQNSFYQSLIAYKAAVQTGKTVFSPATQTRNFGSAGFFPMHVGHIGGSASVTDSFKIVMDDIFGAGRTVNEADLIKRITRKIELGVLDENIVASELGAILKDIKAGKLQSLGKLAERVENTKFYKQATRVYAGGDNVWKWYGHEYYMSQLKGAFRNIDDVKRFFEDIHGIEFNTKNIMTGAAKTLDEGIEEAAAFLLRETYPTYSKVPEFIKAIRKLPIGNFVSFTSEILRTGFSTSAIAMKHIASDNQVLREMGYRMLSGQAITLGGMTTGAVGLGHALTNVTPTQMEVYKEYFAPEYMKYSTLIPVTNQKDGAFKVFDLSRYNPYDIIVASAKELMRTAEKQNYSTDMATLKDQLSNLDPDSPESKVIRQQIKDLRIRMNMNKRLDSDKITTDTLRRYLNTVGPLYDSVTGTFFGIPIGAEAFIEAYTGRTRQGSPIWSEGMAPTEIFDRAMGHFFKTIEPGIISSGRKLFYSLRGDVSGVGQPLEVDTELFKLAGGSNVTVDILGSLDFKISDFQKSFREARVAKDYFSVENFKSRGPEQLVLEYREQNEQAFRAQYEFYKAAMAAIDSGLLTRTQVVRALTNRISPGSETIPEKVQALMQGRYNALSYGPEGLKSRREKIIRNNPDLDRGRDSLQYFLPFGALEREKRFWQFKKFSDLEEKQQPERQREAKSILPSKAPRVETEPVVPEIADTPTPQVQAAAPAVSPITGLTTTETALLSPGEQAIRLRQKQGVA